MYICTYVATYIYICIRCQIIKENLKFSFTRTMKIKIAVGILKVRLTLRLK